MSQLGKISLLVSGLSLFVALLGRYALGQWQLGVYIPLGLFIVFLAVAIAKDHAFFKEFLTMKTTKHGMNMGVLIVLVVAFLVIANFIAVNRDMKWDLTSEKINSLSDQSRKVVEKIEGDAEIVFFYRGRSEEHMMAKNRFKDLAERYEDRNSDIKITYIDSIKRPDIADQYQVKKEVSPVAFVTYKGRKIRADEISEQGLTTAFIRVSREGQKKIYFVTGHGERDPNNSEQGGVSDLKQALEDASYATDSLSIVEKGGVPEDASVLLILGPEHNYLEAELKALKDFLKKGGQVLVALDPANRSNITNLVKQAGVAYDGHYVLDQVGQLLGASAALALGMTYSKTSEISKDFGNNQMSLFHLATALKRASETPAGVTYEEVVKTGPTSITTDKLQSRDIQVKSKGPHILMMTAEGQWPSNKEGNEAGQASGGEEAEFSLVVAGDSDFVSNEWLFQNLNRDLVLNSIAYLSKETDLISIRPKKMKGTSISMSRTQSALYAWGLYFPIPVLLFVISGTIWYRRRGT